MENFGSWSVLTVNFLILQYIALGGVTLSALLHLINGKWRFQVRKLACSLAVLFPITFVLLLVLLANGESTFQWLEHAHDGDQHLSGWHNYTFLVSRQIIGFLIVVGLYGLFIKLQHQSEIDSSYKTQRRFRNVALLIPFAYFLYGTMVAWDFEMTMMPGWHSASYGAYHFISNFHGFLAFFTIFLFFLYRSERLTKPFEPFVFNYLAQLLLGFTILFTYLYFTQYLIMWYARFPEEIIRYRNMMFHGFGPLWWTFLALKFIIPFVTLVFTPNRHNPNTILMVAISIFIGTWIERYTWIAGSVEPQFYKMPMTSLFGIGVTVVIAAIAFVAMRWSLTRYGLIKSAP